MSVSHEGPPRRSAGTGAVCPVVRGEHAAYDIFIDVDVDVEAEGEGVVS